MGPSNKFKRRTLPANYVYKTIDDFMRWQKAQEALKMQEAKDQSNPLKKPLLPRKH